MKNKTFLLAGLGVVVAGLIAVLFGMSSPTEAEAAATFLIRGDVMRLDKANGTVHVYIRHVNSAAEHFAGEVHEIHAKSADFYKYDSKQRKVRSTFGDTITTRGQEVVVRGTVDSSNHFEADWVVRNDTTVKMLGYVRGQSVSNDYLTVEIDTLQFQKTGAAYKATTFPKGAEVRVYYDDDSTKFVSRDGNAMLEDEISNNNEKVTIENMEVKYGSRFDADVRATITDGKWLF